MQHALDLAFEAAQVATAAPNKDSHKSLVDSFSSCCKELLRQVGTATTLNKQTYFSALKQLASFIVTVTINLEQADPHLEHADSYWKYTCMHLRDVIRPFIRADLPQFALLTTVSYARLNNKMGIPDSTQYIAALQMINDVGEATLKTLPASLVCMYEYYVGKFQLQRFRLESAVSHLQTAFNRCHAQAFKQKRLILISLTAARMIRGSRPSLRLLQRYQLELPFRPLLEALPKGNLPLFLAALESNQRWHCLHGHYLVLMRGGRALCYRSLVKKSYSLFKLWDVDLKGVFYGEGVANSFLRILRLVMAEEEIGALEVEALLSSLIRQRYIQGQLDYSNQYLALSRNAPFPPVHTVYDLKQLYDDKLLSSSSSA